MLNRNIARELDLGMDVSTMKIGKRESAVAITSDGEMHRGTGINSQTHLLTIPAGQSALYSAVQERNFEVAHLTVKHEAESNGIDPLLAQVVIDFAYRTGHDMSITVVDAQDRKVASVASVEELAPHYHRSVPAISELQYVRDGHPTGRSKSSVPADADTFNRIKALALDGMARAFTTADGSTRYGAVAVAESGEAYFAGQWGSYDHRTNIHAEMGALMLGILDGVEKFTTLGVISDKFVHECVEMCGCCRQFAVEVADSGLEIITFGIANDVVHGAPLGSYLPNPWSSEA